MAKKKQSKKRNKKMTQTPNTPDFSVPKAAPKVLFGGAGSTGSSNVNTASMRSPGSQRKR